MADVTFADPAPRETTTMTTYKVTFRIGGHDATDQHRTATVESDDERGALDAAAARLWGKRDGDIYVGARWEPQGAELYGRVWQHASLNGGTGGGWDAATGTIGASVEAQ